MPTEIIELHVARDDLARIVPAVRRVDLDDGDVLFRVDRFALTANNITYAAHGVDMDYWRFFPAPEGWGIIPVWGFADVVDSRCDGIDPGARIYGYWPMATHAILRPTRVSPRGFVDGAAHRQGLAAVYNGYQPADPAEGDERAIALFRPLYLTSFLLADVYGGATARFVLSSASSKTALGMAQALAMQGVRPTGLTSARNEAFVRATGFYSNVIRYDSLDVLDTTPTIYFDFAGDRRLRRAVHEHLGDALAHSIIVGDTHVGRRDDGGAMPGPKPEHFFAPAYLATRLKEARPDGFPARFAAAWTGFLAATAPWLSFVEDAGPAGAMQRYAEVLAGNLDPAQGLILRV